MYQYPKGQFRFPLVPDREDIGRDPSRVDVKSSRRNTRGSVASPKPSRQKGIVKQQNIEKEPLYIKWKEQGKAEF